MEFEILENGDLAVSIPHEDDREEFADILERDGYWPALIGMSEPHWTSGSFHPFPSEDANPFVGITSAPCIAECMDMDDDGNARIQGRFWYLNDYMTRDDSAELIAGKTVIYTLAR